MNTNNSKISASDIDVKEYRSYYRETFGKETSLSKEDIVTMVLASEDDMEPQEWAAEMKDLETAGKTIINPVFTVDGDAAKARAVALASRESEGMSSAIETVMKAKEDWQGGPLKVLLAMSATYGEDMETFPVPDSEGGNNPDKFSLETTDSNGKTVQKKTSFYIQFADATKEGRAVLQELEYVSRSMKTDPNVNKSDIPAHILDMSPDKLAARQKFLTDRRGNMRSSYKKAMQLYFQFQSVNELAGISARPLWEDDEGGEVMRTGSPILVITTNASRMTQDWRHLSISNFLKLNPKKAEEGGGTFKALLDTLTRAPKEGQGGVAASAQLPVVKTVDTFDNYLSSLAHYVDEVTSDPKQVELSAIYKKLNGAGSDDFLVSIFELYHFLAGIVRKDKLAVRYQSLIQGDDTKAA